MKGLCEKYHELYIENIELKKELDYFEEALKKEKEKTHALQVELQILRDKESLIETVFSALGVIA